MQTTATKFTAFAEPNPLGDYVTMTAPTLGTGVDAVLDRIDYALAIDAWLGVSVRGSGWTHIEALTRLGGASTRAMYPTRALHSYLPKPPLSAAPETLKVVVSEPSSPTMQLEASLADLQKWLGIGLDAASAAAGISRGTVYAWRDRQSNPRPATVGAILRIHALIAAAVRSVGEEQARAWFHAGAPSPLADLRDARGDASKLRQISTRLRRELIATKTSPPNRLLAATIDDLER